jgi:hypothetical protein
MKLFLITYLLMAGSSTCIVGQPSPDKTKHLQAVLDRYNEKFAIFMNTGKLPELKEFMSPKIRLMPPFQNTMIGADHALSFHSLFTSRFLVKDYSRKRIEILDLGKQVVEIGTMSFRLQRRSAPGEQVVTGTYLGIWEGSEVDGLRLITEAWNYDQYLGTLHDEFKFAEVPSTHAALLPTVPVKSNLTFELAALNHLLDETVTQHDARVWSQFYADDAMLAPGYTAIRKGRNEIDAYIKKHVDELPVFAGLDIRNDRVDDLGRFVVEYASHIASWKNGDSSGVSMGKNIRIWKRQEDHCLKLFRSIAMYD